MEFLYAQLTLHSISSVEKRNYYRNFFDGDVANFIHTSFKRAVKNTENVFDILLIKFTIEVLKRDFFQWRKHDMMQKKDESREPLITAYLKNPEAYKQLLEDIKNCQSNKPLKAMLLKLFSFVAVFYTFEDENDNEGSLKAHKNSKQRICDKFFKEIISKESNQNLKSIFIHSYLLWVFDTYFWI